MNSDLLPGDEGWPEDKVLIADLSSLNAGIARYIVRHLDADAGHAEPISVEDEQAFGLKLVKLGNQLQRRAAGREPSAGEVIQGGSISPPAPEHGQQPGRDPTSELWTR
jgi:hypothetical protein